MPRGGQGTRLVGALGQDQAAHGGGGSGLGISSSPLDRDTSLRHASSETPGKGRAKGGANVSESPAQALDDASFDYGFSAIETTQPTASSPSAPGRDSASKKTKGSRRTTGREPVPLGAKIPDTSHYAAAPKPAADPRQQLQNELNRETVRSMKQRTASAHHDGDLDQYGATKPPTPRRTQHAVGSPSAIVSSPSKRAADPAPVKIGWNHSTGTPFATAQKSSYDDLYQHTQTTQRENNASGSPDAITKSSRGGPSFAYAAVGHRANGQPVAPSTSSHGAHQTSSSVHHHRQPAPPGVGGTLFNNDKGARSDRDHTLALARDEASASTRRALYSATGEEELSPFTAREKALREENENNSYQTVSSDAAYHPGGGNTSASGYRHKVSGGVVGRESGPAFDTTAEDDQIQAAINASLISASEEEITRHTEQRSEAEADAFSPSQPESGRANATAGDGASNRSGENKEGAIPGQAAPKNGAGELSSAAPAAASTPSIDPKLEEMMRKFGNSSRMCARYRMMKNAGLGSTNGAAATTLTDGAAATPPGNGDVLPLDGDPKPSIPSVWLQRRRDRSPAYDDIYDNDEGAGNVEGRRGPQGEAAAQRKSLFHHRANTAYGGASAPPPLATSRNTDPRSYNGRVGDNGSSSAYSYNASASPYSYSSPAYTLPKSFNPPASTPSKYSLNPIKITDSRRMAGLANIGNSCYAGATLSLLFQDTTIRTAALKGHETLFYNAAMALHDGLEQFIDDTKTATKTEEGETKREDADGAPSTDGNKKGKKGETEEAVSVVKAESQKWSTSDSVIQPIAIFKHYQKYAARVEHTVSREQRTATWTKHQKSVAVHRALSSIIQNGCLGGKNGATTESPDRTPRPLQSTQLGTFFLDGMQHDAHEFLVALFMRIQAEEAEIRLRRTQPEVFEQHAAAVAAWESKHQELPPANHGSSATVADSSAGDMSAPTAFTFSQTQPDSHHSFYGHAGGGGGGGAGYDDDPLVAADDYENGGGSRNRSRERSPQFSDDESWMNTTIKSEKKHPVRKHGGAYEDGAGLGLASFEQQKCDVADLTQERIEAEKRQMEADAAAAQSERKALGVSGMLSSMMPRSLRLKPPAAKPAAPTTYETVHEWNRPQPDADEKSESEESLCRASESTGRFEDARSEPEVIEEHEITDQGVAEERTMSDLGGGGGILVDDSTPGTTDQRASRRSDVDMDPAVPACGGQVLVDDSTSSEDDLCKPEFRPSQQHLKNPRVEELDDGSSEDAAVPLDKSCVDGGAAQPSTGQSVKQLLDDEVAQIEAEDEDAPLSTILHKRRREVMPTMRGPISASERSPQKGRMPEKSAEANVKTEAAADAVNVDDQTGMDKTVDTTSVCATRGTDSASPCSPQAYEVPSFATTKLTSDNDGSNEVQASGTTVEGGAGQRNSVVVIPDTQAMVDGGGSADRAVSKESSVSRVPAETPRPPDDPMDMFSHADKEAAEDECWLSQLVQGRVVERTECKHNACGHVQTKRDRFTVLSIPCKTSVAEGVRAFLSEEEIDSYKCDRCKTSGKQFMTTTFESLPTKLFVHLKRFSMRVLAGRVDMVKNNAFVSADPTLRLQETRTVVPPAATNGKGRPLTGPVVTEQVTRNYRLSGVVQHHGMSLSAGHYTARVLCDDDGKWYELDDSAVSSSQAPHPSSNLYILEYTMVAAEGEP